jgi:hypothetical protein
MIGQIAHKTGDQSKKGNQAMTNVIYHEKPRLMREKMGLLEISSGVILDKIQPGGKRGPDDVVLRPVLGGQVWTDSWTLGEADDDFILRVPDIRMPANQYYPLHYHGCWIAVIILDGTVLIGDWWMKPGDVLVAAADLEYGPVLNGPEGCQLFEMFAKDHLALGGYAKEYHDHPTLVIQEIPAEFTERTGANTRNNGNQVLPNAGVPGLTTGVLQPGRVWDLGERDDPNRGAFTCTALSPGESVPAHKYRDGHSIFVLEGGLSLEGRELVTNDVLVISRDAPVASFTAGAQGAKLLEVARTIRGLERQAL